MATRKRRQPIKIRSALPSRLRIWTAIEMDEMSFRVAPATTESKLSRLGSGDWTRLSPPSIPGWKLGDTICT